MYPCIHKGRNTDPQFHMRLSEQDSDPDPASAPLYLSRTPVSSFSPPRKPFPNPILWVQPARTRLDKFCFHYTICRSGREQGRTQPPGFVCLPKPRAVDSAKKLASRHMPLIYLLNPSGSRNLWLLYAACVLLVYSLYPSCMLFHITCILYRFSYIVYTCSMYLLYVYLYPFCISLK